MSSNPFDYVKAINETKERIPETNGYLPYIVNKTMSFYPDTIVFANEMNAAHHLDQDMQFHFYLNTVRKQKRYSGKWPKSEVSEVVKIICQVLGYSVPKAHQALECLSAEQIEAIRNFYDKGG